MEGTHTTMTEKKRLVREAGSARPRAGRLERNERTEGEEHHNEGEGGRRGRRGRPPLMSEVSDINRGVFLAGIESAAIALDVTSRVLRGAVDRAFDEDYSNPGDIIRGISGEADLAVYDLVNELRAVPRKVSHRFDDALRSPRADQGERARRSEAGATTPADSPAAKNGKS